MRVSTVTKDVKKKKKEFKRRAWGVTILRDEKEKVGVQIINKELLVRLEHQESLSEWKPWEKRVSERR